MFREGLRGLATFAAVGCIGNCCSTGEFGRSLTVLVPRGLRAKLASALRLTEFVLDGFSTGSELCSTFAVWYDVAVDEPFLFSLIVLPSVTVEGALAAEAGAGLIRDTFRVAAEEGPDDEESDCIRTDSFDFAAVSSLMVLAARLTVPLRDVAALDGALGGGISAASLLAFSASATRGLDDATSFNAISFKPRPAASTEAVELSGLDRAASKSLIIDV